MPYDDDPYWKGLYTVPESAQKSRVVPRSPEKRTAQGVTSKYEPRAPEPSPLLKEWMEKEKEQLKK